MYDNEKYDSSEFIRDSLNDNEFYEALKNLLYTKNDQYISFKIGNFDIAKKYREKIKCNINQLKEKIIRYKIFESFCGKQFSRVIFSNNNIEFRQIYESNRELHDIFIQLILFFNNDHELSQIDLSLFLKIIACVIVFYYAKKRNGITTIETILSQELSGLELKKAQDYIIYLRTLLNTYEDLSDEEYFKLFGRIRTKTSSKNSQEDRDKAAAAKAQAARDAAALRFEEQRNKQKQGTRSTQIIGVPQTLQSTTKNNTNSTPAFVNKKKTATDEDKSQIIMKAFENMNNRDSILMPLLGFNETISFGKKSNNFVNQEDTTEMNTITTLKTIYAKHIPTIDLFFDILNQLSQLIKINDKKEGDYKNILNKVTNLIDILTNMSGIFTTSISNTSLRSDIKILLSSIIDNLTKNIGAKYDDEYQLKFPKKREELTENQIKKYLLILEILDDKSFNGQSPENKRKYIDTQYKLLALEKHTNRKVKAGINNENNTEFQTLQDAKNKLMSFYEPVNEPVNNPNKQTNNNTNNFSEFKRKYLKENPRFMPVASSEQNDIEILKLIKKAYKESKESNLLDIIIKKINIENLSILKLDSLNSLKSLFQLFSPFNILYNTRFTEINNISGNFILLVKNDIVIRFTADISSLEYLQLCSNIDKYIKYILHNETFINGTVDNEEIFKQSVYYNFFLNLRSIIDIILNYLTDKNPRYEILFRIKKVLDNIIKNIHRLDTDKNLGIFKTKKNQSDVLFVPNKFNVRKTGQEQKRELKGKIMKEIDELFKSSKNSLNKLYNSKTNQTDEEEKKIILLDELKKLIRKLLRKYNISFEDFVKGKDNDIKEIIESFFKKLNSDLGEKYSQSYVDDLITQLIASETKSKFLKEKILDPVIINLVNKLLSFKAKRLKGIILELLYIIVISFTSKRQLSQNIKRQKEEIQIVNNSSQALLSKINKENKEKKMALIVVERLNNKAKQLNSLGPSITNEQKQNALDKELKKATRELKVTPKILALALKNKSTPISNNVGNEFFTKLKQKLLLLEDSTTPKQPKKNMNKPVVPKSQNNNSSQNKKTKMALIVLQRLYEKESSLEGKNFTNEQIQKALDEELKKVTTELNVSKRLLALVVGNHNTPIPLTTKAGIDYYNKLKSSLLEDSNPTHPKQPKKNMNKPVVSTSQTRVNANSSNLTYNSLTAKIKSEIVNQLKTAIRDKTKTNIIEEIAEEINRNRPSNITTPDKFKKEIQKRFRLRKEFKPEHNDGGLIQELSSKYINKNKTEGEQKDYLEKIFKVVKEVKKNHKELGINTAEKYKKEIEKILNKNSTHKNSTHKNSTHKNELIKNELIKNKKIIKGLIKKKINKFEKNTQKVVSKVTNEEIETSIDNYLQNNDIQNKSFNDFIDYLFSKKTNIMEQIN